MSLKSRPDGLDQKLILMPQQKQSLCALNTKITILLGAGYNKKKSNARKHYIILLALLLWVAYPVFILLNIFLWIDVEPLH
jgi:hypothetical protein